MNERGTLREKEAHPAIDSVLAWIGTLSPNRISILMEAFSSLAIEDNRLAEVCGETLRRLINKEPVSVDAKTYKTVLEKNVVYFAKKYLESVKDTECAYCESKVCHPGCPLDTLKYAVWQLDNTTDGGGE